MEIKNNIIIVRGGGDIATGIINALHNSGFRLIVLEVADPSTIRRTVAVSSAVRLSVTKVEEMTAVHCLTHSDIYDAWAKDQVPVITDESADILKAFQPLALVDAILAKKNLGTNISMAELTIGVGPGFEAGKDTDLVIETMRGHTLGRIISSGSALPNTGIPGLIAGHDKDRVIHAPATGILHIIKDITSKVAVDDCIATITGDDNSVTNVTAGIAGTVRGMISEGYYVKKGLKIADIDPRNIDEAQCFTISDKARCIGGSVLEAIMKHIKDKS